MRPSEKFCEGSAFCKNFAKGGRPCKFSAIPNKEAAPSSKNRLTEQLVMHSLGLTTERSCLLPLYIF